MQALCAGDRLAMLLERAFQTRDELLFKVLRNLSQQADLGIKGGFLPYMDQLAQLLHVRLNPLPAVSNLTCVPAIGVGRLCVLDCYPGRRLDTQ